MLTIIEPYKDWKDFFTKRLVDTGAFRPGDAFSKEDTDIEIYVALKGNPDTIIKVGYFSPMTLIYVEILNPSTPGKNRQQEIEHLYKSEFDNDKQYGPPGLDFTAINVDGISRLLDQGFNGSETVYYRKGKPVKSRLTTSYYPEGPQNTFTYHYRKEPFLKRLLNRVTGRKDDYDEVKTFDLRNIFKGVRGS